MRTGRRRGSRALELLLMVGAGTFLVSELGAGSSDRPPLHPEGVPAKAQVQPEASGEVADMTAEQVPGAVADDVREVVAGFHAALAAGDADAALALLHPEVRIYEQGHPETLEEYRAGHLEMDMAFAREVEREVVEEELVPVHGAALYLAETRARGTFRDREIDSAGVETAFLEETPEGWRIRHFHWSSRP